MPTKKIFANTKGFTLIEMVIVVVVVGIVAAITISTINVAEQKDKSEDTLRRANLDKLIDSIETYRAFEGNYPRDNDGDGIIEAGEEATGDASIALYIEEWPDDSPIGAEYRYFRNDPNEYGIVVEDSQEDWFKYRSTWGQMRECQDTVNNRNPALDNCD